MIRRAKLNHFFFPLFVTANQQKSQLPHHTVSLTTRSLVWFVPQPHLIKFHYLLLHRSVEELSIICSVTCCLCIASILHDIANMEWMYIPYIPLYYSVPFLTPNKEHEITLCNFSVNKWYACFKNLKFVWKLFPL